MGDLGVQIGHLACLFELHGNAYVFGVRCRVKTYLLAGHPHILVIPYLICGALLSTTLQLAVALSRAPFLLHPPSILPFGVQMLPTRIRTLPIPNPSTYDIFASSLSALFTDDTQPSHGDPGSSLIYASPRFGDIVLHVPARPAEEEGRKLFAHYLWNAGVVVAEGVEGSAMNGMGEGEGEGQDRDWGRREWWDVRGKSVLEVGAGMSITRLLLLLLLLLRHGKANGSMLMS